MNAPAHPAPSPRLALRDPAEAGGAGVARVLYDPASGSRELDAEAAAVLGTTAGEVSATDWRRYVHPEDQAAFEVHETALRAAASGLPRFAYRLRVAATRWCWFEERLGQPSPVGRLSLWLLDIDTHKRMLDMLSAQERRVSQAIQVSGDGWWDWDLGQGRFQLSPGWLLHLGLPRLDPERGFDQFLDLVVEADRTKLSRQVGQHISGQTRYIDAYFRVQTREGRVRWVQMRGAQVARSSAGMVTRMLGTLAERTEVVDAQRDQQAMIEKFDLACAAAEFALVDFDFASGCWGLDARATGLLGVPAELRNLPHARFRACLDEEDRTRFDLEFASIDAPGADQRTFEFRVLRATRACDVELSTRIHRDAEGRPLHLVGVVRDVTREREARRVIERHRSHLSELVAVQTRAAIDARDRADAANSIKSEFLANMSHELRTPLHAIIGFSQLALDEGEDLEVAIAKSYFARVNRSARQLLLLVDDLLDLSKLESGTLAMRPEQLAIAPFLGAVLDELAPLADARQVRLLPQVAADLHWRLDASRFAQVVRNLVMNAIKYSPEQGAVELAAAVEADGDLVIRVRDHGEGIPDEALALIFRRFQQAQNSVRKEGTGLGLAIAREIVHLHGGEVLARNHPQGGAEFVVRIAARHGADASE